LSSVSATSFDGAKSFEGSYEAVQEHVVFHHGVAVVPLGAQNFAEITGMVSDHTGAVITGASLTIMSTATH
jgi:hypothetical protein